MYTCVCVSGAHVKWKRLCVCIHKTNDMFIYEHASVYTYTYTGVCSFVYMSMLNN